MKGQSLKIRKCAITFYLKTANAPEGNNVHWEDYSLFLQIPFRQKV